MVIGRYGFNEDGFLRLQKDVDALINQRNLTHQHISYLYTDYVEIKSEDGRTQLDGANIKMYGTSTSQIRMQFGYSTASNDFEFSIYDSLGNQTIFLNSTGEAVFAGNIQTDKNIKVGQDVYIGSTSAVESRRIYMYNGSNFSYYGMSTQGDIEVYSEKGINIITNSSDFTVTSLNGYVDIQSQLGFSLFTNSTASTDIAEIYHDGSGDFSIRHDGSGALLLVTQTAGIEINLGTSDDVVMSNNSWIGSTNSTSKIATQGLVSNNYATLSTTITQSYVDGFGYSLAWTDGTRTLELKDRNGNTISSVVISS